ncbi:MAG: YicC/YloC family endoribonuclease [Nitrospirota bacterium]
MTGFGRAEAPFGDMRVAVEVRSVNHRFCEVAARLPKFLTAYETRFRKVVQGRVARGRVDLSVNTGGDHPTRRIAVDVDLARQYQQAFRTLKDQLGVPGEVSLDLLISARDVLTTAEPEPDVAGLADHVEGLIGRALDGLDAMRRQEGESIAGDVTARLGQVAATLDRVAVRAPKIAQEYAVKLRARVASLAGGVEVDPARLAQEVALYAERCDYSEEVTRIRSHLGQFAQSLQGGGEVGRSLDFLTQELNREINTIGSKANDADVAAAVVSLKSELEKVREQIQNIE